MKKRLFAGLLSLLMLWTMLPVSALAVGDETESEQDAYFYVLKPESRDNPETQETTNFIYAGQGTITAPAPINYLGQTFPIARGWEYTAPQYIYEIITYENNQYQYTESEAGFKDGADYYYIEWYRYASNYGANSNYPEKPALSSQYPCWHIDGYPVFSGNYAINFKVKMPGKDMFSLYPEGQDPYIQYITKGGDVTVESVDEPTPSDTQYNGVSYVFDGWYIDEKCTEKAD